MSLSVEVFYDCSSPWTYLAFVRLVELERELGRPFDWKPVLVGGVFNAVNRDVYEARANPHPVKARYYVKDLQDWARHRGVVIGRPPVFPVKSTTAMRGAFHARDEGRLQDYSLAVFKAYWEDMQDISDPDVVAACARNAGLDPDRLLVFAQSDAGKQALIETTTELIERGGFGSPTVFLGGKDMFFGNDRLELIEASLLNP